MNEDIVIPDEAVKYILFQRTGYIKYAKGQLLLLLNKYGPFPLFEKAVAWEAAFRREEVKGLFRQDIFNEYQTVRDHLPEQCQSVLDIGCGVGGIDLHLFKHYQESKTLQFFLLDKSFVNKRVFYNFKPKGAFYNSLQVTERLLTFNGVPVENIHLLEATEDNQVNVSQEVDLVISLISWGFHYPVSTYLNRVYNLLRKGGRLIIDVRYNTDGVKLLEQKFASVNTITNLKSGQRVLAVK